MQAYLILPDAAPPAEEADALLADAFVTDGHPAPRLAGRPAGGRLLLRIPGIAAPDLAAALDAALPLRPWAILLPAGHGCEVAHLGARLAVHEAEHGLPDGITGIVALAGSARAVLDGLSFAGASPRLRALGWDAPALAAELGVSATERGAWIPPLAQARALTRLAAAAAGVPALEAAYPGADAPGLSAMVASARRDGFQAMLARDATQAARIRGAAG